MGPAQSSTSSSIRLSCSLKEVDVELLSGSGEVDKTREGSILLASWILISLSNGSFGFDTGSAGKIEDVGAEEGAELGAFAPGL